MIGGPIGKRLIEKKNLLSTAIVEDDSLLVEEEAVRTQKPVIEIQEENDQHLEEEREQT